MLTFHPINQDRNGQQVQRQDCSQFSVNRNCMIQNSANLILNRQSKSMSGGNPLKIKYFNCPQGNEHEGQALNYVCIEKSCKSRGLLCSMCRAESHCKHNVVPLKIMLQKLQHHQEQPMQSQNFQDHLGQIETIRNEILYELRLCVESIAQQFMAIQKQLLEDFSHIKIQLLEQIQLNMKFQDIISSALSSRLEDQHAFTEDMARIACLVETTDLQQGLTFQINLTQIVESYNESRKGIGRMLEQVQSSASNLLNHKSIQSGNFKPKEDIRIPSKDSSNIKPMPTGSLKYTFSSQFKGSSLKLEKSSKSVKQGSGTERFVMVNEGLGVKKQSIAFKITTLKNWIGLGIGIRDNLQKQKYQFHFSNNNHGSYLVSSNGFTWSHSNKNDNIVSKNFNFKAGDIIEIRLNEGQLQFKKRSDGTCITLKLSISAKEWPHVCFCVNLCSTDDAVEIVD